MAQKPYIDGAGYTILGGKPLIDGVGYSIIKGRTLIGGAGYDIPIDGGGGGGGLDDFLQLMAAVTQVNMASRNSGSQGSLTLSIGTASTPNYVLTFCEADFSISKVVSNVATLIYQSNANIANMTVGNGTAYYKNTFASTGFVGDSIYGGMLAQFTLPANYTEAQADAILGSIQKLDGAGRNTSSSGTINLACSADSTLFAVSPASYNGGFNLYSPVNTRITGQGIQTTVYYNNGVASVSTNGSSAVSTRNGSLITIGAAS